MWTLGSQIIAWLAWHRGLRINLSLMAIPKEAVANYCSTSLFFFASTKIGISHENLEKIFTKTYRKAVPWTYKIVLIMFVRGKVWAAQLFRFKQPSQTAFFFTDPCFQIFFNHFEESLGLYFVMFSTASVIGHRSHYLLAIASTRQSTRLTGVKLSCNQRTNSPSLLDKKIALHCKSTFFTGERREKERKKRSSNS